MSKSAIIAVALLAVSTASLANQSASTDATINPNISTNTAMLGTMSYSQYNVEHDNYSIIGGDQCANSTISGHIGGSTAQGSTDNNFSNNVHRANSDQLQVGITGSMSVGEISSQCKKAVGMTLKLREMRTSKDFLVYCDSLFNLIKHKDTPVFNLLKLREDELNDRCLDLVDVSSLAKPSIAIEPSDVKKIDVKPDVIYSVFRLHIRNLSTKDEVLELQDYMTTSGMVPSGTILRTIPFISSTGKRRYSLSIQGFDSLESAYSHAKWLESSRVHWIKIAGVK